MHAKHLAQGLVQYVSAIFNIICQDNDDFPVLFSHMDPLLHYLGLNKTVLGCAKIYIYLIFLPALRHQRVMHGWDREANLILLSCSAQEGDCKPPWQTGFLQTVWQPDRDHVRFYWAELNGWDQENDSSFHCPGALSISALALWSLWWKDSDLFQNRTV